MSSSIKDMADQTQSQLLHKNGWLSRAKNVGLNEDATERQVVNAEGAKLRNPHSYPQPYPHQSDLGGRARAVGLPVSSTEDEIRKAEGYSKYPNPPNPSYSMNPSDLVRRARLVGLGDNATEKEVLHEEGKSPSVFESTHSDVRIKDMPDNNQARRDEQAALKLRAKHVGLTDTATLSQVIEAESKKK